MHVTPSSLHRALEHSQFSPYFQPLVALHTGRLLGFEVLARWKHPKRGLILPNDFIPFAEGHGFMPELMQQVLSKAFESAPELVEAQTLAINVSATQLCDENLPGQISRLTEKAQLAPSRLIVEVTESAMFKDMVETKKTLSKLKAMGCQLALDDFGTGYSNLCHLQSLPFDMLKIDRCFVASMSQNPESRKIVAAIIGLGRSLGMTTIAEGVETEEQANTLLRLGCEMGQGWLYGRPVPAQELVSVIASLPHCSPAMESSKKSPQRSITSSLEALPTQSFSQLKAIYDGAPVGLAFLDTRLRYVSLNQCLADINGRSIDSHLGCEVKEIIGEAFATYEPYLHRALQGEAATGVEVARPGLAHGEPNRATLASYQPVWDEADEVIGVSVAVMDITHQKVVRLETPPKRPNLKCGARLQLVSKIELPTKIA